MHHGRSSEYGVNSAFTPSQIFVFGFRFLVEYIKEDQVGFEAGMKLNMGQWLSIPLVLAGIALLVWVFTRKPEPVPVTEQWSPKKGVPKK